MKKKLTVVLAFVLVVAMSVAGTYAYLTSQASVNNTFTVGKVGISMDEAKVDECGKKVDGADRVTENKYKLIPGHEYTKDPTIHVAADSEGCWLFVKVENGIENIEAKDNTIAGQMKEKGWTAVDGAENVYAYEGIVSANTNVPVFDTFKVSGTADIASYKGKTIVVTAYAVQADGFDTAAKAWNATFGNVVSAQ